MGQIHSPNECGYTGKQNDVVHCVTGARWRNTFVTHAFRYATIVGDASVFRFLNVSQVAGLVMQYPFQDASALETSDPMVNSVIAISMRSIISNTPGMGVGMQTDCPGRERFGYGGDVVASCEAISS